MTYDIIGNIAIIKSERGKKGKMVEVKNLLKQPNIKTVLEKVSDIKGRLRTFKIKFLAGEKKFQTIHKENNCFFKLNVKTCYFSPRMANDRLIVAEKIKKIFNKKNKINKINKRVNKKVLVMFSGIGSYPIVIYKIAKPDKIVTIEISKECNKYAIENLKLNKINKQAINIIQGDVRKILTNNKKLGKFDVIVMARPNLKESFLKQAHIFGKKGTKIFYHGFCHEDELGNLKKELIKEAGQLKRKIKIINVRKIGEIAPYKFRWNLEIKFLS